MYLLRDDDNWVCKLVMSSWRSLKMPSSSLNRANADFESALNEVSQCCPQLEGRLHNQDESQRQPQHQHKLGELARLQSSLQGAQPHGARVLRNR